MLGVWPDYSKYLINEYYYYFYQNIFSSLCLITTKQWKLDKEVSWALDFDYRGFKQPRTDMAGSPGCITIRQRRRKGICCVKKGPGTWSDLAL